MASHLNFEVLPYQSRRTLQKKRKRDKARFMNIAQGSLEECRYYLILTKDLKYGNIQELNLLLEEVSKLLNAYRKAILDSES